MPGTPIEYCRIPVEDMLQQDLTPHFKTAVNFIDKALSSGGRILVHCARVSSCTCVHVTKILVEGTVT